MSYTADGTHTYGALYYWPPQDPVPPGTTRDVYDWDFGTFLGTIPVDVNQTYTVIGNVNDQHLSIGETTFGGIANLSKQEGAVIDYGSLIWIALARSKTAREGIKVMTDLVAKYGYASSGESFSLVDPNEAWVLEMIGKGNYEKGAVWVARRVPDGHIASHANQARITTIDFSDSTGESYMWSDDVVSFAKDIGLVDASLPNESFSFSDVYDPVDAVSARVSEGRVWSLFNLLGDFDGEAYNDYIFGHNLTNRMPFSVPVSKEKPGSKLTLDDVFEAFRNHKEGTVFDPTKDVGAGPFGSPYRWRPLEWNYDPEESSSSRGLREVNTRSIDRSSGRKDSSAHHYINERTVSTQQTAWQFVAEIRGEVRGWKMFSSFSPVLNPCSHFYFYF